MESIIQAFSNKCVQLVMINTTIYATPVLFTSIYMNSYKPFLFTIVPFLIWNNEELLKCAETHYPFCNSNQ